MFKKKTIMKEKFDLFVLKRNHIKVNRRFNKQTNLFDKIKGSK